MSNSSPRSVTPLVLEPTASRRVRLITLCGLLLAELSVALLPLPLPGLLVALVVLSAIFAYGWRHHPALSGAAVRVSLDSDGRWHWGEGEQREPVTLLGDSYHLPYLAILNFRTEERWAPVKTMLLTTDNIDADIFRRLRVHLNWQEGKSTQS